MTKADRVTPLLDRFPGPISLEASKLKWLGILVLSLGSTFWGIAMITARAEGAWLVFSLFAFGAIVAVVALLPGAIVLTLDSNGFTVVSLYRSWSRTWNEVNDFDVVYSNYIAKVGYNWRKSKETLLGKLSLAFYGRNDVLPDSYSLGAANLARLMAAWRERAVAS